MSLRVRFRFDGRCRMHPRYNPQQDGSPAHKDCAGCESLYVIFLYSRIARRRAATGDGLVVANREALSGPEAVHDGRDESQPIPHLPSSPPSPKGK
jgi:hypothetical protein